MSTDYSLLAYGNYMAPKEKPSYMEIIQSISFLTKVGALFLITGKIFMFMAVAGIFVPSLNAYAIPCTIIWGGFVFTSIILCSVDHYIHKRESARNGEIEEHSYSGLDALMYGYTPEPATTTDELREKVTI